jgi:hypothetical protein
MGASKSKRPLIAPGFSDGSGSTPLLVATATYDFSVDGGAISTITLKTNTTLPAGAIISGATVHAATAPVGTGATVAIGTLAGSSTTSILTATAITSLTLNAVITGTVTGAAPIRLTAAGAITVTIATAALTAGKLKIYVHYVNP